MNCSQCSVYKNVALNVPCYCTVFQLSVSRGQSAVAELLVDYRMFCTVTVCR